MRILTTWTLVAVAILLCLGAGAISRDTAQASEKDAVAWFNTHGVGTASAVVGQTKTFAHKVTITGTGILTLETTDRRVAVDGAAPQFYPYGTAVSHTVATTVVIECDSLEFTFVVAKQVVISIDGIVRVDVAGDCSLNLDKTSLNCSGKKSLVKAYGFGTVSVRDAVQLYTPACTTASAHDTASLYVDRCETIDTYDSAVAHAEYCRDSEAHDQSTLDVDQSLYAHKVVITGKGRLEIGGGGFVTSGERRITLDGGKPESYSSFPGNELEVRTRVVVESDENLEFRFGPSDTTEISIDGEAQRVVAPAGSLLSIDYGHGFSELAAFRKGLVKAWGFAHVQASEKTCVYTPDCRSAYVMDDAVFYTAKCAEVRTSENALARVENCTDKAYAEDNSVVELGNTAWTSVRENGRIDQKKQPALPDTDAALKWLEEARQK